jgi:NDP-sugar pyrophosphorylase family protein
VRQLATERPGFYTEWRPGVFIGEGTVIADTATVIGPAIFGAGCEVRHAAFVRNDVIAGDGCVIGNSTELKNCLLLDAVQVPHFNYVGDSVLGYKAHLGAGVILSNVRLDNRNVVVTATGSVGRGERTVIDTGLQKFGALVGDGAEVGCNSVLNPGTIVGKRAIVYPLSSVRGIVPAGAVVKRS